VSQSLEAAVIAAVSGHPAVDSVALAGSRSRGEETELSDWDFQVETRDFPALAIDLATLVAPLEPLARQWDRLSPHPTYMLMLRGPLKVDLLFLGRVNEPQPPWRVTHASLPGIDRHFWDWALWLASKDRPGDHEGLVAEQLELMHEHLLAPLGAHEPPDGVERAVRTDVVARERAEREHGVKIDRALGDEVLGGLRRAGYAVGGP
jgi:hypothetical protein